MRHPEYQYLDILNEILTKGIVSSNRTEQKSRWLFGRTMRFDLQEGFPLLTTKKVFFRGVFEELMLFLRGDTNTKHLEEKGVNIWKGNTSREFLDKQGLYYLPEGELGCSYSHQWRNFGGEHPLIPETKGLRGVDQISKIIDQIKEDPNSRRIYVFGSNPAQEHFMALAPCHTNCVFNCEPDTKKLHCSFVIRSNDFFHGNPFNIAQYALLTEILAKATGYIAGELVYFGVNVHIYENHIEAVREQLKREPRPFPHLEINKNLNNLDDIEALVFDDVKIVGYNPHPSIRAEMVI